MRRINKRGLKLLMESEGFRSQVYDDGAGYPTIGYGHLIIHRRGKQAFIEARAMFPNGITKRAAKGLLRRDLAPFERGVEFLVKVELNDNQFSALVDFAFNLGLGALKASTLLKRINSNRFDDVPNQLNKWVFAGGRKLGGLAIRRKAEGVLFNLADTHHVVDDSKKAQSILNKIKELVMS